MGAITTMRTSILISFATYLIVGCAEIPVQEMPSLSSFDQSPPLEWADGRIGSCPNIQGKYSLNYSSFGTEAGAPISPDKSNVLLIMLSGRYDVEGIVVPTETSPSDLAQSLLLEPQEFILTNQTLDQFQFVGYLAPDYPSESPIERKTFIKSQGHYSCVNGLIQLPRRKEYYGYQGGTVNRQSSAYLGKLADGSLLLYEQWGPWKKTVSKGSSDIRHEFYVFPPAKQ